MESPFLSDVTFNYVDIAIISLLLLGTAALSIYSLITSRVPDKQT